MSEVLEKVVGQVVERLNAAATQRDNESMNIETVELVCRNLNEHLTNALNVASSKETPEEKLDSLVSSVQVIRQAVATEPQKLRNAQRELNTKCAVYTEVLEMIKSTHPVEAPPEPVVEAPPEPEKREVRSLQSTLSSLIRE